MNRKTMQVEEREEQMFGLSADDLKTYNRYSNLFKQLMGKNHKTREPKSRQETKPRQIEYKPESQKELLFFRAGDEPTREQKLYFLNPENKCSPYYGFVGNRKAVNKLIRIDYDALGKRNHLCNELAVAFLGQAGSGKTELARRHARANGLPLVEISPRSIKKTQDIFDQISQVCVKWNVPLVGTISYLLPPINVFIDEVHALVPSVVQGLLKATEHRDGILVTEKHFTVDCRNVHWMIATTDRGKLFDAFDTRFTKVILHYYTKNEIAQIVQIVHPDWPWEASAKVAHYCSRIPREALAFAREMKLEYNMRPASWEHVAFKVANDNEIDEYGMTFRRLAILKALGQGPIAEKRLPIVAGVKAEELEKFTMPWLLASTTDQMAMVSVGTRGYQLTAAGVAELDKRNISHVCGEELGYE